MVNAQADALDVNGMFAESEVVPSRQRAQQQSRRSDPATVNLTNRSVSHDEESQGISNHAETKAKNTSANAEG